MTIYGYARVSTFSKTLDAQQAALKAAGAERVFSEKVSGAKTNRAALTRALGTLGQGDVLLVNPPGQARPVDQRPSQRAADHCRAWSRVPIACRYLGRHNVTAWPAHDYDLGRAGRVRTQLDPCKDRRRSNTCDGARREVRPQAQADAVPSRRSYPAPRGWRSYD